MSAVEFSTWNSKLPTAEITKTSNLNLGIYLKFWIEAADATRIEGTKI